MPTRAASAGVPKVSRMDPSRSQLTREDLKAGLALLDRVDALGAPGELVPVGLRLDGWLDGWSEVPLPSGGTAPEPGLALGRGPAGAIWLLRRGRLVVVPDAADGEWCPVSLTEADLAATQLTDRLRAALLAAYLGGADVAETPDPRVPAVVADLLDLSRDLNPAGRQTVLGALAGAMRRGGGWDHAATRLRIGFERALGDRSPDVVGIAAEALVRMAAGLGPRPPAGDPTRELTLLFRMPRPAVRVATLQALLNLSPEGLSALRAAAEPVLAAALDDDDAEVRRLASAVQRRLGTTSRAGALAEGLESADRETRLAALSAWPAGSMDEVRLLLPLALEAADDPDDAVSTAAVDALRAMALREGANLGRRIAHGLLSGRREQVVAAGASLVTELAAHDPATADGPVVAALRSALSPLAAEPDALVGALVAASASLPVDEAVADLEAMLWHPDQDVRRAVLERLAAGAVDRVQVRDALLPQVAEHARDPVPELRLLAARSVAALGVTGAGGVAGQLAYDPDRDVRHGALTLLAEAGEAHALQQASRVVELADTLLGLAVHGRPEERLRWTAALEQMAALPSARVPQLLLALLRRVPQETTDPFHVFALDEIHRHLKERTACGMELVELCRQLLAPPDPRPEHAARLAAACAAEQPLAFDFLWTMHAAAAGAAAAAAAEALVALVDVPKATAVQDVIADLLARVESPAQRSLLRMLVRGS